MTRSARLFVLALLVWPAIGSSTDSDPPAVDEWGSVESRPLLSEETLGPWTLPAALPLRRAVLRSLVARGGPDGEAALAYGLATRNSELREAVCQGAALLRTPRSAYVDLVRRGAEHRDPYTRVACERALRLLAPPPPPEPEGEAAP